MKEQHDAPMKSILRDGLRDNNPGLVQLLGLCPLLAISTSVVNALGLGIATVAVLLVSNAVASLLGRWLLPEIRLGVFVVTIATAVTTVELLTAAWLPGLNESLGIFLPLITTNCAILGVALFQTFREYSFLQCLAFSLGAGVGFTLALMLMAGLRERLELSRVPDVSQGAAMTLMLAGLLSLAFMGFAGLGGQHA